MSEMSTHMHLYPRTLTVLCWKVRPVEPPESLSDADSPDRPRTGQ